jgi:hypothetical protein
MKATYLPLAWVNRAAQRNMLVFATADIRWRRLSLHISRPR